MFLRDFLSPEAGQKRREWLDDTLGNIIPPELRGWVNAGAELNPVTNMERAGTAAKGIVQPGASGWDRMAAAGDMATNMAAVLAPVAGAKLAGTAGADGANAIVEALTAASPMKGAVDDFLADEFGGVGFRAYHGSPHDFDRFSLDKIGTGEGAQAYGHGLYFADSEDVARSYRDNLSNPDWARARNMREQAEWELRELANAVDVSEHRSKAEILRDLERYSEAEMQLATNGQAGRMYEVNINADPADFLDWDKPLSEQPAKVQEWFDSRGITPGFAGNQSGAELMMAETSLLGPDGVADALRSANVPGVRYLDHGSRFNAMDGTGPSSNTRNYVVFDDKLIEIIRKYGWAAAAPIFAQYGMTPEEAQAQYQNQQ